MRCLQPLPPPPIDRSLLLPTRKRRMAACCRRRTAPKCPPRISGRDPAPIGSLAVTAFLYSSAPRPTKPIAGYIDQEYDIVGYYGRRGWELWLESWARRRLLMVAARSKCEPTAKNLPRIDVKSVVEKEMLEMRFVVTLLIYSYDYYHNLKSQCSTKMDH